MILSRFNKRHFLGGLVRTSKSAAAAAATTNPSFSPSPPHRSLSSAPTSSPTSFSHDKIATDERYASSAEVPEVLLNGNGSDSGGSTSNSQFSIRGQFREGRAAYLDMSATTPLDPRVFDKMAPYMVC